MKNRFLFLLFFTSFFSIAQVTITGTVYEKNNPLEGVAVYFNNTTIGTTTDLNGDFSIKIKEGKHDLIISYLGFKKINYTLNTSTYKKPLIFNLEEENNKLNEIIIRKTVYDEDWKYNVSRFKKEFIGTTKLAQDCKILNPEVLHFDYDAKNNVLTAIARKPLIIKNKGLGYEITYELEDFTINKNRVTYLGYSRYKNLDGSKRKHRKWRKKRVKAYNGSSMHFYQSLVKNTTYKDGFLVHQFKRVPNPERPSEEEIKKAREFVQLNKEIINSFKIIDTSNTALTNAISTLNKVKLPKFIDYLYKSKIPVNEIISQKNGVFYLDFENNISVVYTKELEETGFITRNAFSKIRNPLPQSSAIIPLKFPSILDKDGALVNPLDVFYEGYWSYEKFADSLPLDYIPIE
ncbi:CarboxypepD_reg-like domain-containing protein [Polaribacter sp. KT25b]|uniref:carboxypeptidase-like regulatory domain-containing protein n=1 Tax=Polaribacter sp. KT25b TaxID=1855336 RepID=UPI00087A4233|nr:carboxypeptidase-like regulatory domain-containing protein [Polaribacter sp. KT25b]SDS42610.1 CarboxypepD_reg-like domain-containing protein [Polaribacter sp. KT25b]